MNRLRIKDCESLKNWLGQKIKVRIAWIKIKERLGHELDAELHS